MVRFNSDALGPRVEQLARAIGSGDLPATLADLAAEVGVRSGLSDLGVTEEDAAAVSRMAQANPFCQANPQPASEEDVAALLYRIW